MFSLTSKIRFFSRLPLNFVIDHFHFMLFPFFSPRNIYNPFTSNTNLLFVNATKQNETHKSYLLKCVWKWKGSMQTRKKRRVRDGLLPCCLNQTVKMKNFVQIPLAFCYFVAHAILFIKWEARGMFKLLQNRLSIAYISMFIMMNNSGN